MDLLLTIKSKSPDAFVNLTRIPPPHPSSSEAKWTTTATSRSATSLPPSESNSTIFVLNVSGTVTFSLQSLSDIYSLTGIKLIDSSRSPLNENNDNSSSPNAITTTSSDAHSVLPMQSGGALKQRVCSDVMSPTPDQTCLPTPRTPALHLRGTDTTNVSPRAQLRMADPTQSKDYPLPDRTSPPPSIKITPSTPDASTGNYESFLAASQKQDPSLLQIPPSRLRPSGFRRLPKHPDWMDAEYHATADRIDSDTRTREVVPPGLDARTRLTTGPSRGRSRQPRSASEARMMNYIAAQREARFRAQVQKMGHSTTFGVMDVPLRASTPMQLESSNRDALPCARGEFAPASSLHSGDALRNRLSQAKAALEDLGPLQRGKETPEKRHGYETGVSHYRYPSAREEMEERRLAAVAKLVLKPGVDHLGWDTSSAQKNQSQGNRPSTRDTANSRRTDALNKENRAPETGPPQYAIHANYYSNIHDQRPPTPIPGNYPPPYPAPIPTPIPGSAYAYGSYQTPAHSVLVSEQNTSTGTLIGEVPDARKRHMRTPEPRTASANDTAMRDRNDRGDHHDTGLARVVRYVERQTWKRV